MSDTTIVVDVESLTLEDIEEIENVTGERAGSMFAGGIAEMKAKTIAGVVFACQRRVDPTFTYEDARKVKFTQIREAPKVPLDEPAT